MIIVIFLLASTGLTMIMVRSKMMMPLREAISRFKIWSEKAHYYREGYRNKIAEMYRMLLHLMLIGLKIGLKPCARLLNGVFSCELCFSFWAGMIIHIMINNDYSFKILIFGFMSSGFAYIYTKIIQKLEGTSCK